MMADRAAQPPRTLTGRGMDELYRLSLALTTWLQANYPQLVGLMAAITALGEEVFYLAALPAAYWSIDKRLGR